MKIKIALAQIKVHQFRPDKNLKTIEQSISQAKKKKADIIVFPEVCITGPTKGKKEFVNTGSYKKHFQKLAKQYNIDIVTGSFIEQKGKNRYNATYYIDNKGAIKGAYQKQRLWLTEKQHLTPGKAPKAFFSRFGKVGLAICWDLAYPEHFRTLIKQEASIIFCPSYWMEVKQGKGYKFNKNESPDMLDTFTKARAFESNAIIVTCNAVGQFDYLKGVEEAIGHSQIAVPLKGTIAKAPFKKSSLLIHTVDTNILKDAEKTKQIRKSLKA